MARKHGAAIRALRYIEGERAGDLLEFRLLDGADTRFTVLRDPETSKTFQIDTADYRRVFLGDLIKANNAATLERYQQYEPFIFSVSPANHDPAPSDAIGGIDPARYKKQPAHQDVNAAGWIYLSRSDDCA